MNRQFLQSFRLLVVIATLYRVIGYTARPEWLGAPQLAMALFAGSVIGKKRFAFALPLFSMLASDVVMQLLHWYNPGFYPGFYSGQLINYALILSITVIGFFVNYRKLPQVLGASVGGALCFWLLSNFFVWLGGGGLHRPFTFAGLLQCYADAVPFLRNSISGTVLFSGVFYAWYSWQARPQLQRA